ISATKIELKGMKTTNAFDTSTINGLKRYKRELIDQRDAVAKTDKAFASYNRRIEATNKRLKRLSSTGISQVGKSFQGLRLRMDKVNTTFSKAPFSQVTPRIGRFTNALGQSRTSLSRFSKSSGAANFAVLGLSQGLQDLPFGFIGIQNNIPMIIRSFSQLRQETGSTRQALKGLDNALLGSGGLFLGSSLLISGITLLTQKYGSLGNAWDVLTGKASALYNKQKQLNKAFENASGLKSYIETSIRLGVELDAVSNGIVSQDKFLKDYNKVIKDSSEKFDNFNAAQQDFLNNNDNIIKAYVKQATSQQLIQKAAGLSTKLIENQKKEASEFVNIWDIIWANIKSQNKHVLRGSF